MAKGLRSKVKKRNRAVMRSTVGKAFQKKKLAETTSRMQARTNVSTSSSSLLAVGALLGGGRPLQERAVGGDGMEDDDDDEEGGEGEEGSGGSDKPAAVAAVQTKNVGINAMPRRTALRGTKNMRKYGVKQVVHVYKGGKSGSGGTAAPRRVGRSLPGSGKRRSGKPKAMAEA